MGLLIERVAVAGLLLRLALKTSCDLFALDLFVGLVDHAAIGIPNWAFGSAENG